MDRRVRGETRFVRLPRKFLTFQSRRPLGGIMYQVRATLWW